MDKLKVVVIGGGSSYTPELIEGFIKRHDELPVSEIWLVDIKEGEKKLNTVGELAKRMVQKSGLPIDIHLTLDRKKALENADFVITQIRVGLLDARIKDERIPLKYGVIGQETNGPGGLFKAFRTIPVILDITKDMKELCPDAWLINFTNPAGIITEAVNTYGATKKIVGLCNVPIGMRMGIAKLLDVDSSRVEVDFAGLNHMVFGLNVYLDGKNVTDKVIDMIVYDKDAISVKNVPGIDWEPEFLKGMGVIPCPYHRYYYQTQTILEKDLESYKENGVRGEVVKRIEKDLFELYEDKNLDIKPPQLEKRGGAHYSDAACSLINSIYNNKKDIQPVNTVNRGAIKSLPDDAIVEVSSVITKEGPRPIVMGDLPMHVRGLVSQIKSFERAAVEAAVTGDYDKALLAMTINPLVPSDKIAKVILDEMLEAHKEYLPQFFK